MPEIAMLLVPVVLGAAIGYVTNYLAIRMLFRPHREYRIFGMRVPLTPGLFVRRRRAFSASVAKLAEERFSCADDLVAAFYHAQEHGMISRFIAEMGPVFKLVWNLYARKTDDNALRQDIKKLADGLLREHVVGSTISQKIDEMPSEEIEAMILAVVHRELRAITWFGALLGALIGCLQLAL